MKFSLWATATFMALGLFIPSKVHSFERTTLMEEQASTSSLVSHHQASTGFLVSHHHHRRGSFRHRRHRRHRFHRGSSFRGYSPRHRNFRRSSRRRFRRRPSLGVFIRI
ncbi:hypothetical protein H1P_320019 [Hyella patelloides LEGE 07179]|uniref:Uncharacterized protein n=1 Tax=Hyella patelloides LEGE 07179 TaxID=945734 RepID=A0A563VV12_9CYAN|nr:hypothetical protein [Hyella patelloides]VEP15248.1 hypothetical protein H1P_320019 [Hyella patelloides LEGE 07179]